MPNSHIRLVDQRQPGQSAAGTTPAVCCVSECRNSSEVLLFAWGGAELSGCSEHARLWLASHERRRASRLQPKQHLAALQSWLASVSADSRSLDNRMCSLSP
jgi:hypothetical protein